MPRRNPWLTHQSIMHSLIMLSHTRQSAPQAAQTVAFTPIRATSHSRRRCLLAVADGHLPSSGTPVPATGKAGSGRERQALAAVRQAALHALRRVQQVRRLGMVRACRALDLQGRRAAPCAARLRDQSMPQVRRRACKRRLRTAHWRCDSLTAPAVAAAPASLAATRSLVVDSQAVGSPPATIFSTARW